VNFDFLINNTNILKYVGVAIEVSLSLHQLSEGLVFDNAQENLLWLIMKGIVIKAETDEAIIDHVSIHLLYFEQLLDKCNWQASTVHIKTVVLEDSTMSDREEFAIGKWNKFNFLSKVDFQMSRNFDW
jgi:hypothetical protein